MVPEVARRPREEKIGLGRVEGCAVVCRDQAIRHLGPFYVALCQHSRRCDTSPQTPSWLLLVSSPLLFVFFLGFFLGGGVLTQL